MFSKNSFHGFITKIICRTVYIVLVIKKNTSMIDSSHIHIIVSIAYFYIQ